MLCARVRARACAHALLLALILNCCSISNESHMKTAWFSSSNISRIFSHHVSVLVCVYQCARAYRICVLSRCIYMCVKVMLFICCVQTASFKVAQYSFNFKLSLFLFLFSHSPALPLSILHSSHNPSKIIWLFLCRCAPSTPIKCYKRRFEAYVGFLLHFREHISLSHFGSQFISKTYILKIVRKRNNGLGYENKSSSPNQMGRKRGIFSLYTYVIAESEREQNAIRFPTFWSSSSFVIWFAH